MYYMMQMDLFASNCRFDCGIALSSVFKWSDYVVVLVITHSQAAAKQPKYLYWRHTANETFYFYTHSGWISWLRDVRLIRIYIFICLCGLDRSLICLRIEKRERYSAMRTRLIFCFHFPSAGGRALCASVPNTPKCTVLDTFENKMKTEK